MSNRRKQPVQGKVNVVSLSNYTSPDIRVTQQSEWVTYGKNNEYFQYLLDRYSGSPTNNAIINGISQMIYGKGLDATDSNTKPNEYAQMITLLKKDAVRKFCYDLKLMGQCAIQVVYSKDRKTVSIVEHMPIETIAIGKCDENGDIKSYFYFHDWSIYRKGDKVTEIPSFGTSKENIELLYVKPYVAGHYYFSPVDYQGCLQYCELEEEVSNYHLNNVHNGLAPSMLINFNNGVPNEEERSLIENRILEKYSGSSNAGKAIISFNENTESQSTIEAVQLSDAHNQYQFLSDESMRKIMVGNRVVSPMLLGIKDNSGLGNNADELMTASNLMDNTVIRPFQELLIDSFDKILAVNNISLNLYFKTLQPLEFTTIDDELVTDEVQEEETGIKLTKDPELTDTVKERILSNLVNDEISNDWEMVDELECDGEEFDDEVWANYLIDNKKNLGQKLSEAITGKPSGFSYLDKSFYKVRYKYYEKVSGGGKSRDFCSEMMSRTGENGYPAVYRIEDIDRASREGINSELGHNKQPYDLYKFKGGIYCHHVWKKVLFRLKDKTNESPEFSDYKRTRSIPKSYISNPWGTAKSKIAPINMPNGGAYPTGLSLEKSYRDSQKRGFDGRWVKENKTCLDITGISKRAQKTTAKEAREYVDGLNRAKELDPERYWSVDPISYEDAKEGVIISKSYGALFIAPNGDIKGLYKNPDTNVAGVGVKLVTMAVNNGGRTLDNFDGYLTGIYEKAGFRTASRVPFDEEYSPVGWNKQKHGNPNVVSMIYDPNNELFIDEQMFTGPDGYEEMIQHRNKSLNICN